MAFSPAAAQGGEPELLEIERRAVGGCCLWALTGASRCPFVVDTRVVRMTDRCRERRRVFLSAASPIPFTSALHVTLDMSVSAGPEWELVPRH
jgi:hypothetical protein